MNPVGRMHHNTPEELIQEFLAKGGTITKCQEGSRTEEFEFNSGFYKKKKKEPKEDT